MDLCCFAVTSYLQFFVLHLVYKGASDVFKCTEIWALFSAFFINEKLSKYISEKPDVKLRNVPCILNTSFQILDVQNSRKLCVWGEKD